MPPKGRFFIVHNLLTSFMTMVFLELHCEMLYACSVYNTHFVVFLATLQPAYVGISTLPLAARRVLCSKVDTRGALGTQGSCCGLWMQSDLITTSPLVVLPYTGIQSDLFTTSPLVVLPYTSIQSNLFTTPPLVPHFPCHYNQFYCCNQCCVWDTSVPTKHTVLKRLSL